MSDQIRDVAAFHQAMGQDPRQRDLSKRTQSLRYALIKEEYDELCTATSLADEADALVDLAYVIIGSLIAFHGEGTARALWNEVHRSNMAKFEGERRMRPDGKVLKPEGWTPPDIDGVLDGGWDR